MREKVTSLRAVAPVPLYNPKMPFVRTKFSAREVADSLAGLELLLEEATTVAAVALASAAICFMEEAATVAGFRVDVAIDRATTFGVPWAVPADGLRMENFPEATVAATEVYDGEGLETAWRPASCIEILRSSIGVVMTI